MTQPREDDGREAPLPRSTLARGILVVLASATGLAVVGVILRIAVVANTFETSGELRSRAFLEFTLVVVLVVVVVTVALSAFPWVNSWRSWKVLSPILLEAKRGSLASLTRYDEKAWGLSGHGRYVVTVDENLVRMFCVDRRTWRATEALTIEPSEIAATSESFARINGQRKGALRLEVDGRGSLRIFFPRPRLWWLNHQIPRDVREWFAVDRST
jgi:hypothetical protein